jgi:hypothetical protein
MAISSAMANRIKRTPQRRNKFLKALAESGIVGVAIKAAGICRDTAYLWRKDDSDFAQAWDEALEQATEKLEAEAYRRAHDGVLKPVFQNGQEVGQIREYSNTLLIFLLKAQRPEKYRDNAKVELSGPNNGPIPLSHQIDLSKLSPEEKLALADLARKARG